MTTTKHTEAEDNLGTDDALAGEKVGGSYEGPIWSPQLAELNDKRRAQALADLRSTNPRSTAQPVLRGALVQIDAWGRMVYALELKDREGQTLRVKVPEHTALYGSLGRIKWGTDTRIEFQGYGKAKAGKRAPCLYEIVAAEGGRLSEARPDALTIVRRDDAEAPPAADDDLPPELR